MVSVNAVPLWLRFNSPPHLYSRNLLATAQLLLALNVWGDCLGEKPYECQVCGQKFSWSSTVAIQATFYDGAGGDPPNI